MNYIVEMKLRNNVDLSCIFFKIRETMMVHKNIQ
jgi:hypothetical protein